jgi:hypothetical protein
VTIAWNWLIFCAAVSLWFESVPTIPFVVLAGVVSVVFKEDA